MAKTEHARTVRSRARVDEEIDTKRKIVTGRDLVEKLNDLVWDMGHSDTGVYAEIKGDKIRFVYAPAGTKKTYVSMQDFLDQFNPQFNPQETTT